MIASPSFMASGACVGTTVDFFPEKGGSYREARALCNVCPVQAECLDYALRECIDTGMWGGASPAERAEMAVALT